MNSLKRRTFLKGTAAIGSVGFALGAGLLTPRMVMASWPKSAFDSRSVDDVLTNLVGSTDTSDNERIQIRAPDIAENGNVVPITVETTIANIETISILTEQNAAPLTASFVLGASADGFVATRMKMGKTSDVIAVVKADGKLHSSRKEVKVTIGGCGG